MGSVVLGAGGGATHHAPDDLALMSLLPGMTVVALCDPGEIKKLTFLVAALKDPKGGNLDRSQVIKG